MGQITSRVWELVSKADYLTEDKIKEVLNTYSQIDNSRGGKGSIKRFAYVLHDKDVYTGESVLNDKPELKGQPKEAHWHVVMEFSYAQDIERISSWFGVSSNFFEKGRGQGAFLEKCIYLTHENESQQEKGKHRYDDDEIVSSFDFRNVVDEYVTKKIEQKLKYGKSHLTDKEELRYEVLRNGMTIDYIMDKYPLLYSSDRNVLHKLRLDYLSRQAPAPIRINIYIDGSGRVGKDVTSFGIARSWYPELSDRECFHFIGGKNVAFEDYDGQPVIIWSDRRAEQFLEEFGRENLFSSILNTFPVTAPKQHKKFGYVPLVNTINIINGVEPYKEFMRKLVAKKDHFGKVEIEDINQVYGRFPIIIPMRIDDFDILLNKGYMTDNIEDFKEYFLFKNVRGSMKKIFEMCNGRDSLREELTNKLLSPVVEIGQELIESKRSKGHDLSDDEIREMFKDYGSSITDDEFREEYENVFCPLWEKVNKKTDISRRIDYNEWLDNGRSNAYDKEKGFYRISDKKSTP